MFWTVVSCGEGCFSFYYLWTPKMKLVMMDEVIT